MIQLKNLGTDNLKKLIDFGIQIGDQVLVAESDGKFTWTDGLGFIDELMQVPTVLKSAKTAGEELLDLDEEERQGLNEYVIDKFNLPNEVAADVIEKALNTVFAVMALVSALRSARK